MITKDQLADAMMRECDICQHLYEKLAALGPAALEYRPSPSQRTMLELLRSLSVCGIAGLRFVAEKRWAAFSEFQARTSGMSTEDFPAAMTRQKTEIHDFFEALTEEQLETQEALTASGATEPLGLAILCGPFKWLTGYKLQLFLYAKAAGLADLGTSNAWAGMDPRTV